SRARSGECGTGRSGAAQAGGKLTRGRRAGPYQVNPGGCRTRPTFFRCGGRVSDDASSADLVGRLRPGGDDAAWELFIRFARRQVGLAPSRPAGAGPKTETPSRTAPAPGSGTPPRRPATTC